jgi:hypothetical protein
MSQPSGNKPASAAQATVNPAVWEFGDIGFDTEKKLWFVQFYNDANQNVGTHMGKRVVIKHGRAAQYEWKDGQGRAFWHVRERFFADEIESISLDAGAEVLTVVFRENPERNDEVSIPEESAYILYAFHLSSKEMAKGNKPPLGFLEFYTANDKLVKRLNNRWILIEDLDRRSVGEYPSIRLRIDKEDVHRIITTRTSVVVQGKPTK